MRPKKSDEILRPPLGFSSDQAIVKPEFEETMVGVLLARTRISLLKEFESLSDSSSRSNLTR